jgi:ATP-dependent helicase YprA (DUF1998 family)
VIPAREAKFRPIPGWVTSALSEAYHAKGIQELYLHQAATAELVHEGKDVVVVTPTASGKPSYNLPVLHAVPENPDTRALYLFPTKALAQDQLVREALAQLGHSNRAAMIAPGAYRRIKAQFEHRLARLARKAGQTLLEFFDS